MEIIGDYEPVPRIVTGLYSLDRALGNPARGEIGMPANCLYELYGYEYQGKSTLVYFLAGKINPQGEIFLADLDGFDPEYLKQAFGAAGFSGKLYVIPHTMKKGKRLIARSHSQVVQEAVDGLEKPETSAVIFDSVSTYQPIMEKVGDMEEQFVGRRAKAVGQWCRRALAGLRDRNTPAAAFVTNHAYQVIGGRGETTAGGMVLKATAAVRLKLQRKEQNFVDGRDDFMAEGRIVKLRYGGKGRTFRVFIVAGRGVHPGMTAVFDCFALGLAERSTTVKIGDKSYGYMKSLIEAAADGSDKKFDPFLEALRVHSGVAD